MSTNQTMVSVSQPQQGELSFAGPSFEAHAMSQFSPMPGVSPAQAPMLAASPPNLMFNSLPHMLSNPNQHPIQQCHPLQNHPLQVSQPMNNLPMVPLAPSNFQRSNSTSSVNSIGSMGSSLNSASVEGQPQFNAGQQLNYPLSPLMYSPFAAPQLVPMVQYQTPDGQTKLQPLLYYPPHPNAQMSKFMPNVPMKRSSSGSKSFDGSEYSDEGKGFHGQRFYPATRTGGMQRCNSDQSRDGFENLDDYAGSDVFDNRSRNASTYGSENGNENNVTGSPERLISGFDSLMSNDTNSEQSFQEQISEAFEKNQSVESSLSNVCDPNAKQYSVPFLMSYQAAPECTSCPSHFEPEDYTTIDFLKDNKHANLAKYVASLESRANPKPEPAPRGRYGEKKRPTSKERQEELFKTELCNAWINGQKCRFGKRCIFAHGQHELRKPRRKLERLRQKPPLKKHIMSILNRITDENSQSLTTELLCCCVEEVVNDEKVSMIVVKGIFTKACTEQPLQSVYANMWQKLINVHPMRKRMQRQMFELCLCEYAAPKSKYIGLGCMCWIAELCRRNLFGSKIVYKILDDLHMENKTEQNIEFWCKLIENLRGCINTNNYFDVLAKCKSKFSSRVRFMIMELEELRRRNWIPKK